MTRSPLATPADDATIWCHDYVNHVARRVPLGLSILPYSQFQGFSARSPAVPGSLPRVTSRCDYVNIQTPTPIPGGVRFCGQPKGLNTLWVQSGEFRMRSSETAFLRTVLVWLSAYIPYQLNIVFQTTQKRNLGRTVRDCALCTHSVARP